MAEPIEMPFGLWAQIGWGAHLRNLTNTIEPSMCGSGAAFLSNCFDHLLLFFYPQGPHDALSVE